MSKTVEENRKPFSIQENNKDDTSLNVNSNSVQSTMSRFKDFVSNSNNSRKNRKISDIELDLLSVELPEYERLFKYVKTVGRGSFGIACLYERLNDGILVVLKQIHLKELSKSEKELAMNEVDVFSKLHHPNIISYYGSFVRGEVLYIEMEYAEDGNLAGILSQSTDYLPERYVLNVFEQVTSAINYMHSENILHRDLKAANVFLKRGIVKIGDFGISKIMNTKIHTHTILGTPYYFSPEMCEGKEYNEKSDIWALGCILGEMCCKQKTFSASNLSDLVQKIMFAQYNELPEGYSDQIKHLLSVLLKISPIDRPSASDILKHFIPLVYLNLGKFDGFTYNSDYDKLATISVKSSSLFGLNPNMSYMETSTATMHDLALTERSVLYQLKSFGSIFSLHPLQLPSTCKIKQISTSGSHFIVVTAEGSVYSWGEGMKGQLGHTSDTWKHFPTKIDAINRYNIISSCAGDGFSIFLSDYGLLLSCGENSLGCLGHSNTVSVIVPKSIEKLLDIKIKDVTAHNHHVLALDTNGNLYSWGSSEFGALALGKQNFSMVPIRIPLAQNIINIVKIYCGPNCSLLLLGNGDIYACGKNNSNKLGFGRNIETVEAFRKIPCFKKRVLDFSVSDNHSAFIIEGGYVITIGSNSEGQSGLGHNKQSELIPKTVTKIADKYITQIKCHPTYNLVCTDTNCILFWGMRYGIPDLNEPPQSTAVEHFSHIGNSTAAFTNFLTTVYKSEFLFNPTEIFGMYASDKNLQKGIYIKLKEVLPLTHSILVWIDTTTPLVTTT
ncbi:unnamed protein product [Diamesa serratosioi]